MVIQVRVSCNTWCACGGVDGISERACGWTRQQDSQDGQQAVRRSDLYSQADWKQGERYGLSAWPA